MIQLEKLVKKWTADVEHWDKKGGRYSDDCDIESACFALGNSDALERCIVDLQSMMGSSSNVAKRLTYWCPTCNCARRPIVRYPLEIRKHTYTCRECDGQKWKMFNKGEVLPEALPDDHS